MSEAWDDEGTTTAKPSGFGFGSGGSKFGKGFGRGLSSLQTNTNGQVNGFGHGASNGSSENGSSFGSGRGGFGNRGGFGSNRGGGGDDGGSSGGGFGSKPAADDGWGESSSSGGGFGSRSGFGGGGRGGKSGGFGSSDGDSAPRGGGFGSRGGGGGGGDRTCHKCHEAGHMARECPNSDSSSRGGGGGDRTCHKCNETGHIARDCPNAGSGGGGGDRACHKCKEVGHFARECPNSESSGGGGGDRACHKCKEVGHFARECPNSESSGGGGGDRTCHKCQETGHFARECPQGGGGGGGNCFKCDEPGHMARDCPNNQDGDQPKRENYIPPDPTEDESEIFQTIEKGINFDKYDAIPVESTGHDVIPAIRTFAEANLYPKVMENVQKSKYEKPTPIQKHAIPAVLAGRDLMGCAQTGSGKTAAFLLPVLTGMFKNGLTGSAFSESQEIQALVITPTRELAIQIYEQARKFSHGSMLRPVVCYGGTSTMHQTRQIEKGAHIVIGTPGRLNDFISKGKISLAKLKYLILDEADRMLDMGFEPEVRKIVETYGAPPKTERQTLMFSATFPEDIQKLASDFLNNYLFVTVGRVGGANTDVEQVVFDVEKKEKRQKLCDILSDSGSDRTLVFVESKRSADFLASYLSQTGFPTTSIHGDRLQREREEALDHFKRGTASVLIATSVAARGLDIPNVKHVVNHDLPKSVDEYVHRIGRTGRCGNLGKATSFYDRSFDGDLARDLVRVLGDAQQEVPQWLDECAQGSMGSGFGGAGGKFASRDVRGKRFGNQPGDADWFGDSGADNFGGGGGGGDEEAWD